MASGAIAIFVKTVGLSPVKTRLAEGIGRPAAETFHTLAAQAVAAVIQQATVETLTPYWAVAEPEGLSAPAWQTFSRIWQGQGGLGSRLFQVYSQLQQRHSFVLLVGADSPQITSNMLIQAAAWAEAGQFVIGPAADGGFYLFGGAKPIPQTLWERVPYSNPQTAEALIQAIALLGPLQQLPMLFDVDTVQELQQLQAVLATAAQGGSLCPQQLTLLSWLNALASAQD